MSTFEIIKTFVSVSLFKILPNIINIDNIYVLVMQLLEIRLHRQHSYFYFIIVSVVLHVVVICAFVICGG